VHPHVSPYRLKGTQHGWTLDTGANLIDEDEVVEFRVWAPLVTEMDVAVLSDAGRWLRIPMEEEDNGFYAKTVEAHEGTRYMYVLDCDKRRPDPVSRYQPDGVHDSSEVVNPDDFDWLDQGWKGVRQEDLLIYEIHVGTYTPEGTFQSLIPYLDYLRNELGVTAVELMPVGQFPGERNWGYDGVSIYAPQNSYGGPDRLKKLVDDCHTSGLAVFLDVVYNHLGPDGNYLGEFGPYFSPKHRTPWGPAINYDGRGCDQVRRFVVDNSLYWITEYHLDGLRLDAVHGITDLSPKHILTEIGDAIHAQECDLGRKLHVIAESDLNDPKIISPKETGGYGLDAQWSDDFHHSVHSYLTGERFRYYQDFGGIKDIEKALRNGFVYDGRYSKYRGRTYGAPSSSLPGEKFVIFMQNHDQVGNRPDGARLGSLLNPSALKVAVGLLLLAPNIPLLFMGEEFGETAPFYYFVSHTDPKLVEAVSRGRKKEIEADNTSNFYADPQDRSTFEKSKVNHGLLKKKRNREIFQYYRELIELRKTHPALKNLEKNLMEIRTFERKRTMVIRRREPGVEELALVYVLGAEGVTLNQLLGGRWEKIFDSTVMEPRGGTTADQTTPIGHAGSAKFAAFGLAVFSNRDFPAA
jgi:maltooligosyltrehalose trehalohydrolase